MNAYEQMLERVRDGARDCLSYLDNDSLGMAFRNGFDDAHEIADGAVPVYTYDIFDALQEGQLSSAEPEIEGATTPVQMAQFVLYDECYREVCEFFEAFKDDEDDERERFEAFLDLADLRSEEYPDCEEAYLAFGSARSTIESEVYEEIFANYKED